MFAGTSEKFFRKVQSYECPRPQRERKTVEVSSKIGRGKHSTRHVELISAAETCSRYADLVPAIARLKRDELQLYLRNSQNTERTVVLRVVCITEPDCAVKRSLEEAKI